MQLEQKIIDMYERTRSNQFIEELQQMHSVLEPFAQIINVEKGKYFQMPAVGSTSVNRRKQRYQQVEATELDYGLRAIKGESFEKFLSMSTDDELFLHNLPINLTQMTTQLAHAAERAKDEVLMGTAIDAGAGDTKGQYIIKTPTTVMADGVDGSPYKGGATGGLLGANYVGEDADEKVELSFQPTVEGTATPLADYTKYTATTVLDLKRTNVIPVNFVRSGTPKLSGINNEKLAAAVQAMSARYATHSGSQLCCAITHRQALELMTDEKFINKLYGFNMLQTGFVDRILGVKFLIVDTLPLVNIGGSGAKKYVRVCPVWVQDNLVYGIWQNAKFHIRRPEREIDTMLAGVTFTIGAGRKREQGVVSILCDEGFTPAAA